MSGRSAAKFRESFRQDLSADAALVMAVTQKAPIGSTSAIKSTHLPGRTSRPGIISSEDRMIHPENEKRTAGRSTRGRS